MTKQTRKQRKQQQQGTYALCITAGAVVGLGLGPLVGSVLIPALLGAALGAGAGYLLNRRSQRKKR